MLSSQFQCSQSFFMVQYDFFYMASINIKMRQNSLPKGLQGGAVGTLLHLSLVKAHFLAELLLLCLEILDLLDEVGEFLLADLNGFLLQVRPIADHIEHLPVFFIAVLIDIRLETSEGGVVDASLDFDFLLADAIRLKHSVVVVVLGLGVGVGGLVGFLEETDGVVLDNDGVLVLLGRSTSVFLPSLLIEAIGDVAQVVGLDQLGGDAEVHGGGVGLVAVVDALALSPVVVALLVAVYHQNLLQLIRKESQLIKLQSNLQLTFTNPLLSLFKEYDFAAIIKYLLSISNLNQMELEPQRKLLDLPLRRKGSYIQKFTSMNIRSNHFHVDLNSEIEKIHIFSIRYNPMVAFDNRAKRNDLLNKGREFIRMKIENPVVSGNNIYSREPPKEEAFSIKVEDFDIDIKQVKVLDLKQNPKLLLSFLNNGLRNSLSNLNYVEIGRSGKYFNTKSRKEIDQLIMFSGYKSNFTLLQNGFYLKVDSAKKIVRNQTALQFIDEIYSKNRGKDKEEVRMILNNELVNKIIMTNYGKTVYHKIQEIVFDQKMDEVTIDEEKEDAITLLAYYETKYGIKIKNLKQPLLKVENKRKTDTSKILLLPELCLMTGIPENFDEFKRREISKLTIKGAGEKKKEIQNFMDQIKETSEFESLKEMGIKISRKMAKVHGRVIPKPMIELGSERSIQNGKQSNFQLFNMPIFNSKHSVRLSVIYFSGFDTKQLISLFESTSRGLKVKLEITKMSAGTQDRETRKSIDQIEKRIKQAEEEECNICLIILPRDLKNSYKKIKKLALVTHKMICQMSTEFTLKKKGLTSIATKILLQIIAKRGNTLWVPKVKSEVGSVMICGFDQAKIYGNKFALSVCATINSTFSSIFSKTEQYEQAENKFKTMSMLLLSALEGYVSRNKAPPKEIIIFQNASSGDQVNMFVEHFIEFVQSQLRKNSEQIPKFTMIMINVRCAERFFTEDEEARNVPAGTLVTTDVVSNYYDFYVVSQDSNRGAIVPNHYKVVYTDSSLEEGVLQELVFSQCFNYVNWTGSIKIPGILQYAQKCAKFNAEVLETEEISKDLQNKLYFV